MEFLQLAKERYSCREFSDRKVEQELVDKILEAAISAPTAVNKQPYKIWVMESEQSKDNIKSITRFHFDADKYLVLGYKEDEAWTRKYDQRNFADVDAAIVGTQIMLEVQDLGLGTTWVGHFNAPKLKELYPQMESYGLIAIFPIGYPAVGAKPAPQHEIRKTIEEAIEIL